MTARTATGAARRTHAVVDSPVGPLTLVAADGALAGLYLEVRGREPGPELAGEPAEPAEPAAAAPLAEAARQLSAYFAGDLTGFDLTLSMDGTEFQRRVWAALRDIPYGETVSYGQLADEIGAPGASRAVGLANGRNPISIIVPCHRVIGADGSLTGYGGGMKRKQFLLDLERRVSGRTLC
jgi:methylated-DNA-[protein]-cysteine S-methyltransferase